MAAGWGPVVGDPLPPGTLLSLRLTRGPARPSIATPVFRPVPFWQPNLHPLMEPTERLEGEEEGEQPYVSGIAGWHWNWKFPEPPLNKQRLTA